MTKTLTEQYKNKELSGWYYVKTKDGSINHWLLFTDTIEFEKDIEEVLSPVPSYQQLYGPNDGNIPVGLFTVLKLIKRDIERYQKTRHLTDLECGIKSQVVSLLKRQGWDLGKDELLSKTDELEKQLAIATKALKDYANSDEWELVDSKNVYWSRKRFPYPWRIAGKALKEMEGVK